MRQTMYLLSVSLILLAGCVTTGGPAATTAETTTPPSDTLVETATTDTLTETATGDEDTDSVTSKVPESSLDFASSATACREPTYLSFYGQDAGFWEPDTIRVGYGLPGNTSMLLVSYVDETVRSVDYVSNSEDGQVDFDGTPLELNTSLSAEHVVQVVAFSDEDGNGEFDHGTDRPCLVNGEILRAGPERIDFGRFG